MTKVTTIENTMEPTEVVIHYHHPRVFVRRRERHPKISSAYRLVPSRSGGPGRDRSNVLLARDLQKWMQTSIRGEWDDLFDTKDGRSRIFRFANKSDALLFKLTWGGE